MRVAGLGQCSLDHISVVDLFPREDTKNEVSEWTIQGGGPVATALVTLSRLGVGTTLMGLLSDDWTGNTIKDGLIEEGVGVDGLIVRKGGRSQTAFIVVNRRTAARTVFWQRPTLTPIMPEEVTGSFIEGCEFLLLDGLMADASIEAARLARAANIPVMLDGGRVRDKILDIAALSDYVVVSEEFAVELAGTPKGAIGELMKLKPRAVTITLGKRGSITKCGGDFFVQPAFSVDAVDTTGAGDVFHGGYIYGLLQNWNIRDTVRFASAAAALKCKKIGGRAGIAGLRETKDFLEIHGEQIQAGDPVL